MPRTPRYDYPGALHHVFNRGACHADVFLDDEDRARFVDLLGRLPERFGVVVLAYALMSNHFHILIQVPDANLSVAMKDLLQRFVRFLNDRHERDGSPHRGRFASRVVETEDYAREVIRYVALNPVAAGLAPSAEAARWTHHAAAVGACPRPRWLDTRWTDDLFGGVSNYQAFVAEKADPTLDPPEPPDPDQEQPDRPLLLRTTPVAEALRDAARTAGVPVRDARTCRGRPGQLVAWALHVLGGLTHADAAKVLGVSRSAVSHRIRAFEQWASRSTEGEQWRQKMLRTPMRRAS